METTRKETHVDDIFLFVEIICVKKTRRAIHEVNSCSVEFKKFIVSVERTKEWLALWVRQVTA